MAAVMLPVITRFFTTFSKNSLFFSKNIYEDSTVSIGYCNAHHENQMCLQPNCRFYIILIGDTKEALQNLDAFCFNYQLLECPYTVFKYRFSGKIVFDSGQLFDNMHLAVHFNHQNRGVDRMPTIAKNRLLRKKSKKKHLLSSFQKNELMQIKKLEDQSLQTDLSKLERLNSS